VERKLKHSRGALKQEKIDLITIDTAKKMIEGSEVLDETHCDDNVYGGVVEESERMITMMTSMRILMRIKRKTNRSRKITLGIFYRPHDMAKLEGPGGVEHRARAADFS